MAKAKAEVVDERGAQPGYTSISRGRSLVHFKIGNRPLTFQEDVNMTFAGLTREEVARMTPKKLKKIANSGGISMKLHLGC